MAIGARSLSEYQTSEVPTSIFRHICLKKWISTRNSCSETEHQAGTDPELFMHVDSGYKSNRLFANLGSLYSLERSPNMLTQAFGDDLIGCSGAVTHRSAAKQLTPASVLGGSLQRASGCPTADSLLQRPSPANQLRCAKGRASRTRGRDPLHAQVPSMGLGRGLE